MGKALYRVLTDGKEVAGRKNPGLHEIIELSDVEAEHPLRIGHIEDAVAKPAAPVEEPPPAPKGKTKAAASAVGEGEASGTLTITE